MSNVAIITDAGRAALAAAVAGGQALRLTHMAVGDAGGAGYAPAAPATALVNELARVEIGGAARSGDAVTVQAVFTGGDGWVREAGVFTADGTLFAVWSDPVQPLAMLAPGVTLAVALTIDFASADAAAITVQPTAQVRLMPSLNPAFGGGEIANVHYIASRAGLVTNGTGLLGNNYNFSQLEYDPSIAPRGLPGAFTYRGYGGSAIFSDELIALDPTHVYELSVLIRQASVPGDWSAFLPYSERHLHYFGLAPYDIDGRWIAAACHMRWHGNGVDSLTTLSRPLSPGDTVIHVANAAGWVGSTFDNYMGRSITIFEYRDSLGRKYEYYSRYNPIALGERQPLFDPADVDTAANTITLSQPLPAAFANPDDPSGTWPAGTRIACTGDGGAYNYITMRGEAVPATDTWYRYAGHIGGVDTSGLNRVNNLPPGTACVKLLWLPNYSNRPGGFDGWPDTGPDAAASIAGIGLREVSAARVQRLTDGSCDLWIPQGDMTAGAVRFALAQRIVAEAIE